jgi:hypothetical protein
MHTNRRKTTIAKGAMAAICAHHQLDRAAAEFLLSFCHIHSLSK